MKGLLNKAADALTPDEVVIEEKPAPRTSVVLLQRSENEQTIIAGYENIPDLSDWSSDDEKLSKSLSDWSSDDEKIGSLSDGDYQLATTATKTTIELTKSVTYLGDLRLHINVVAARQLPPTDADGKSDPYVVMTYYNETYQTKVVENSLAPEWGEQFSFTVNGTGNLEIEVRDKDAVEIVKKPPIGTLKLNVTSMAIGKVYDDWFDLVPPIKIDLGSKIHLLYQLAEKDKEPFVSYSIEYPVINMELLEGADSILVSESSMNEQELKLNEKIGIPIVNFFENSIVLKIGEDKTEIKIDSLDLGSVVDDFWTIGATKAHLRIQIAEKSQTPFE